MPPKSKNKIKKKGKLPCPRMSTLENTSGKIVNLDNKGKTSIAKNYFTTD